MKCAVSLALIAALSSGICFAGDNPAPYRRAAVAEETGAIAGAPAGLRLRIVHGGFQLTWTPSPQEPDTVTGYEIVRAAVFSGPYETVGRVGKGVSSFVDTTARPETIYYYKVRAVAGTLHSRFSGVAAGEIPGRP